MEPLELIISNNKWNIVYDKDNTVKEYWGANTKEKIIYIYNTKEPERIRKYLRQAEQQYREMW